MTGSKVIPLHTEHALELLLELDLKFSSLPFLSDEIDRTSIMDFDRDTLLSELEAAGFLYLKGNTAMVTELGRSKLSEIPLEWKISHLPWDSHDGQK